MKATNSTKQSSNSKRNAEEHAIKSIGGISRRSFLGKSLAVGAGTIGVGVLGGSRIAEASRGGLTTGDAALLRVPAALELLEAAFCIPYYQTGGVQRPQ